MKIVFVVGNSRSGTTMMAHILGRHSAIFAFEELHFFEELWQPVAEQQALPVEEATALLARLLANQRQGYYSAGDPSLYAAEAHTILDQLSGERTPTTLFAAFLAYETARHAKQIACDQTPRNVYYLRHILGDYDQAYIVNMIRDPRDVLLSQKSRWRRRFLGADIPLRHTLRVWAGYHPVTISLLWRSGIRAADAFAAHPRVHHLRFEDLVSQPQQQLTELCNFLDIDFEPDMMNVAQSNSSHLSEKSGKSGIDSGAADRWRHGGLSNTEIYLCQRTVAAEMTKHGYDMAPVSPSVTGMIRQALSWVVKTPLALILNFNRSRNLVAALGKRLGLAGTAQ